MRQIKLFKGIEVELTSLEQEVNGWIRQTQADVLHITGTISPQSGAKSTPQQRYAPSDVLIVVEYEAD